MYDFSDEEEATLPLPRQWIRAMDTSGNIIYKDLRNGNEAEEHPFILQGLDAARKLPLPVGWIVKETVLNNGIKDYFYCNPLFDFCGWDPPQFRSCLAECLKKNGYPEAAVAVMEHPNNQLPNHPGALPLMKSTQAPLMNRAFSDSPSPTAVLDEPSVEIESSNTDPVDRSTARNVDWMELMQHLGTLEEPRSAFPPPPHPSPSPPSYPPTDEDDDLLSAVDQYDKFTERTDNESLYSLTSRRSRRSDKWLELLNQKQANASSSTKRLTTSDLKANHRPLSRLQPEEVISIKSLNRLIAFQIDSNERCHELLLQVRAQLCQRSNITCHLLVYHPLDSDVGSLDTNTLCDHPYQFDQVNTLVTLAEDLVSFLRHNVELLVMALASMSPNSPELLLTSYTILHRLLHPFSSESSMTTSFLLESLNHQIDQTCVRLPQNLFRHPKNGGQEILFVSLLTNCLLDETREQYQPLLRPVFSYHPSSTSSSWPDFSLSLFGLLLRAYGIRRDVTCFFRLIWKPALPALCAVIESNKSPTAPPMTSVGPPPPRHQRPDHLLDHVTFGKLIPIATRLIECAFLDESLLLYPAAATAIIRCLGDLCGSEAVFLYLLEFLLMPNLTKLLLGDVESLDNEEPLRYQTLWNHSEKYFDHRNWWPVAGQSFIESSNHQLITIIDSTGMLLWCVWRIFVCSLFSTNEMLTNFSVKAFFAPLALTASFSGLSETKLRTVLLRIRAKVTKGCESLLQMPLDAEGSSFLQLQTGQQQQEEGLGLLRSKSRHFSHLLRNRLASLMVKPPEALTATVVSRHDTMILFDSISFICEEHLDELERQHEQRPPEASGFHQLQRLRQQTTAYLNLCDQLEDQHVDVDAEDIMLLWRTPPPRDWRGWEPSPPLPLHHMEEIDDMSVFTHDSYPPPPPPPLPDSQMDLRYSFEQLQRGYSLSLRYISSLSLMLHHLRTHKHSPHALVPLCTLLDSEEWFHCPEVDISCPLAQEDDSYHRLTESHSLKLRPNHFGIELDSQEQQLQRRGQKGREEFVPLRSQLNEFFDSFRFQNSSRSAGANTSLEIIHRPHSRTRRHHLIRPSPTPHPALLQYIDQRQPTHSKPKVSYRERKEPTKITLPESSSLLVPTESLIQQKQSRRTFADREKEFMTSLRTPIPQTQPSLTTQQHRPSLSYPLRHENIVRQFEAAQPFPEHLRKRLQGGGRQQEEDEKEGNSRDRSPSPLSDRRRRVGGGTGTGTGRCKERKMPIPLDNSSNTIFAPTESRLRQLNQAENRLNDELSVEQEKGWKNLLRSYDQMSDASSSVRSRSKPFKPSGAGYVARDSPIPLRSPGPGSEHSHRSSGQPTHIGTMTPFTHLLQSRGIDMKSFLTKLDNAAESSSSSSSIVASETSSRGSERPQPIYHEKVSEELPRDSLPLPLQEPDPLRGLRKRQRQFNEPSRPRLAVETMQRADGQLPQPSSLSSSHSPSHEEQEQEQQEEDQKLAPTDSPSTSQSSSSVLFPGLQEAEIFDLSFDDPTMSLGKILSAAKTQHWMNARGGRPSNLQKRLQQRTHLEPQPSSERSQGASEPSPLPIPSPQPEPLRVVVEIPQSSPGSAAPSAALATAPQVQSPHPSRDLSSPPLSPRSSRYSSPGPEGKSPLVELPEPTSPSSPTTLPRSIPGADLEAVLPITRHHSHPATDDATAASDQPEDPLPASHDQSFHSEDSPPPVKRVPLLKKQHSMTPVELRGLLVRGYEVVKVHTPSSPSVLTHSLLARHGGVPQAQGGVLRPCHQ
jgi:hypothetical protein